MIQTNNWNGEYVYHYHKSEKPTKEYIDSLSSQEAMFMAECYALAPTGDAKEILKNYFKNEGLS